MLNELPTENLIEGADRMRALGQSWAPCLQGGRVVFLVGDLGAGKTTLVQGMLEGLGYSGAVKSPTYTLVEPYSFSSFSVYHFDLYRLDSPNELESLGVRDFFGPQSVCLIEWPDRGEGFLPKADMIIRIEHQEDARRVTLSGHWG